MARTSGRTGQTCRWDLPLEGPSLVPPPPPKDTGPWVSRPHPPGCDCAQGDPLGLAVAHMEQQLSIGSLLPLLLLAGVHAIPGGRSAASQGPAARSRNITKEAEDSMKTLKYH
jgi:hypothetical protein